MGFGNRGVVGDKWSSRVLWICAIGSAIGLYMVAAERQAQNRAKMMSEALEGAGQGAEKVNCSKSPAVNQWLAALNKYGPPAPPQSLSPKAWLAEGPIKDDTFRTSVGTYGIEEHEPTPPDWDGIEEHELTPPNLDGGTEEHEPTPPDWASAIQEVIS
ncbi:hypothetical protein ACH5RR_028054 [Cinchona calisaya]|uniref:Uncharacterized protein n=1 Tax=Cinchona calisaya TaxID=153742 RepID=A0ABD2YSZ3_9GENT